MASGLTGFCCLTTVFASETTNTTLWASKFSLISNSKSRRERKWKKGMTAVIRKLSGLKEISSVKSSFNT